MTPSTTDRAERIARYAAGPARLEAAVAAVPEPARRWRPAPGKWSVHEVVCHCADSETNAAMRIRFLVAEKKPLLVGYDQDAWAEVLDYHRHPLDAALATVRAVRANTVPLLRGLPDAAWGREGEHTEIGRITADRWLEIYAEHLDVHARQIERNLAAWNAASGTRA